MMSRFRTIEVSDAQFESNRLRFMTVKTSNLNGRGDICVFVPEDVSADEQVPVVILLHGVYGSAWSWAYNGGAHLQAHDMMKRKEIPPMVIAMPSDGLWGDGSAYLPHDGYDFEKWIVEDVVTAISEKVPMVGEHSPLFIAGLSMGGFGALRIGAKYGSRFSAFSGHSSITSVNQMELFVEENLSHYRQSNKLEEDVLKIMQANRENLSPFRFDCGISDLLIEYNRQLHQQLKTAGIPHVYEEFAGDHQWSYWKAHIGKSFQFFARQLKQVTA
jgi:putative tributyrin esterase